MDVNYLKILVIIGILLISEGVLAQQPSHPDFASWLVGLRAEALDQGISSKTFDSAFADVVPLERVLELDRKQPEFTLTFSQYLGKVISRQRIQRGRDRIWEQRQLLQRIARQYGVQPRFIVALWGIETSYGKLTGGFSVINALATLAYDGRRSEFFRQELLNALKILEQGHTTVERMSGSWAGAMGQCQFMPSSFVQYAVDANNDGRSDIWNSIEDVLSSIANYLSQSGWNDKITWGRKVRLPAGFDSSLIGLETRKYLSDWQALGLRRDNGNDLPKVHIEASVLQPDGPGTDAFLVYDNFNILLKWNRSHSFALSVGHLSDMLK